MITDYPFARTLSIQRFYRDVCALSMKAHTAGLRLRSIALSPLQLQDVSGALAKQFNAPSKESTMVSLDTPHGLVKINVAPPACYAFYTIADLEGRLAKDFLITLEP
ncbi:hypothetical protein [Janthinobacterium sp.]|uniref:hypothetical protein n=1 Tax=Janthinobacterium sp. TaxID=1871054 RepID=UPI00293D6AFF|nr:hypothetical protein [Janthinobacterium sp.]